MAVEEATKVFRWILDVEPEWLSSEDITPGKDASLRWAQGEVVQRSLRLLPPEERQRVVRFYHVRDAKLSLGSQLLKHCAIVRACHVSWPESIIRKDHNHKPCYIPADNHERQCEFNVSHHGSLVALVGCSQKDIQLGVDVVEIDVAKDVPKVRQEGWQSWVNTFEAVFSAREVQDIVSWEPAESLSEEDMLQAKIRLFYAHWCLKEAYVKMTGEALMAPWLQDMDFRNVQVPRPASTLPISQSNDDWGETVSDIEIWRAGERAAQVFLNLPSRPQIPTSETTKLVEALDYGTASACRRLDSLGFQTVYAFIRLSEPCLSQQRGHCIFIESLHPRHAKSATQKASLMAKKSELGKGVLCRLITTFLDDGKTHRARRWVGSLALELLKGCSENRDLLVKDFHNLNQALVQSVLSGNDEILRLIGGTIIHESGRQSQWTTDYTTFIDQLDTQKLLTQDRGFSTFAYAVYADGTTYNTEYGLSIMVSVADDLTIMVPSTDKDSAKYIDIPLENVVNVELKAGGPGSQSNLSPPSSPTVLILHLLENATEAYYINESSRLPCHIQIAFDEHDDAQLTKDTIETIAIQRTAANTPGLNQETASCPGSFTGQILSQSAILNVSSGLRTQKPNNHHDALRSQDKHSDQVNAAPRAHLSSTQPIEMVLTGNPGSPGASRSGRPRGKSKSGVLMSTEMLNVSQKEQEKVIIGRENDVEAAHEVFKTTSSDKAGRTNEALLDETQPHSLKRKLGELGRILPVKRVKINHIYTSFPTLSYPGIDEFDVPISQSKPKDVKTKSHKSSGTFKVSKDGGKGKGHKHLPKAFDDIVKTSRMKQQAKAAGPQKPTLRPRTTRAAAKNAQLKIEALDEESDEEDGGASIYPAQIDSPTKKIGRDEGYFHNDEESRLAFLADAPEFKNGPVHQQAMESNFEDAVAMMNPEEEDGNHNGQPLDNDLSARSVPKEGRIVVTVSGKGGIDSETTKAPQELDLGEGQSLPSYQENSVGKAANVGEVAHAECDQQTQELKDLLPKGKQLKKAKSPAKLSETLSEALSGAFQAYESVPKGTNEVPAMVDTITQQPMGDTAAMIKGAAAQRSEPNLMDSVPQAVGKLVQIPTIKLEPSSPVSDMPKSDWVSITSGPSEGSEGIDGSSHRQSMATSVHAQKRLHESKDLERNVGTNSMSMPHTAGLLSPVAFITNRGARGLSQVSKRKRDDVTVQDDDQPRRKKTRTALYNGAIEQKPAADTSRRTEESRKLGALLEHSSLFSGDMGFTLSGQGSRVNNRGSPLPSKHHGNAAFPGNGQGGLSQGDSEKPRFIISSNSKQRPSSPTAPSAILTGIEAEDARPFEILANGQSHEFVQQDQVENPFIGGQTARRTRFLEKLRQIHDQPAPSREDLDKSLNEEDPMKRPAKWGSVLFKGGALTYGESSETSSSQEQQTQSTQSTRNSGQRQSAENRWRNGLELHQRKMADVLDEISRDLVDKLIDAEIEIEDVVINYERQGNDMLRRLAEDLKVEVENYTKHVNTRQRETMQKIEALQIELASHMKKQQKQKKKSVLPPMSKELAKKLKEVDDAYDKKYMPIIR
ncbi:MAG: hypothetical protein Q9212_006577 [Teloschistes hypoglaucus]